MSHPFGDLLTQHLHRKHGLSQARLAAGILQDPSIIAKMCKGQRLTGVQARERVLLIANWLHQQKVLDQLDEANALLMAAGLAPLRQADAAEAGLLQQLRASPQAGAQPHRPSAADTQSPTPVITSDYPLIGRDDDYAVLRITWRKAMQGAAHFLCIQGDAGIGKTRLAEELLREVQREGHPTARTRAYALEGRLAYGPVADWLRSPALASQVRTLPALWRTELARLLPELLIEDAALPAPQPLTERWQRKQFFDALLHAFTDAQQTKPLLLVLDDLQWCDTETLEWLQYLLGAAAHCKLLVVGTVREAELDQAHPLHLVRQHLLRDGQWTRLSLEPLTALGSTELGAAVAQHDLDAATATQLFRECAGNPLFVIESMRVREGALRAFAPISPVAAIPPKMYGVIAARLAQLSPQARALADVAAVVGRAFSVALLAQASEQDEASVAQGIDELWQRHLLREDAVNAYDFSHDRIRDVAYAEIGLPRRRVLHQVVAETVKLQNATRLENVSAQLATHYEAAGILDEALIHVIRAIEHALAISAMQNGIALVIQGLRIAQHLPETETNIRNAIQLHHFHGHFLQACKTWLDPQIEEAFAQVRLLSKKINDRQMLYLGQTKLRFYHSLRAEWVKAQELAEQNVVLAEAIANPRLLVDAYATLGRVLFYRGNLTVARQWYEKALQVADDIQPDVSIKSEGHPTAYLFTNLSHCLCLLGYPQQARQRMNEGVQQARTAHQFMLVGALQFDLMLNHMQRDFTSFECGKESLQKLALQYDFPFYIELSHLFVGYAMVRQGRLLDGIEKIKSCAADWESQGDGMFYAHVLGLYIEACLISEDFEQGLIVCDKAFAFMARTDDVFWAPEIHRLRGELLLGHSGAEGEAQQSFCTSMDLARGQGSKWFELRASVSLARLWQRQGKRAEAYALLSSIYGWFTEGFDTADLVEAKALLRELS